MQWASGAPTAVNGLKVTLERQQGRLWWRDWCVNGIPINGAARAATIKDRMGCQYNEVILQGSIWNQHLPIVVQAVFYPINGQVDAVEGDAQHAQAAREVFTTHFQLKHLPPLLTYDVAKAHSNKAPWEVAPYSL